MSEHRTFVERALAGEISGLDIDDEIERWHESAGGESLAAWLGMSDEEYQLFVEQPDALGLILNARRQGRGIRELLGDSDDGVALAASGIPAAEVRRNRAWLQRTGRL